MTRTSSNTFTGLYCSRSGRLVEYNGVDKKEAGDWPKTALFLFDGIQTGWR